MSKREEILARVKIYLFASSSNTFRNWKQSGSSLKNFHNLPLAHLYLKIFKVSNMRVANFDGLVTLFYDGSDSYNEELPREWDGFRSPNGETLQSNEDISSDCKNYMSRSW